MNILAIDFGLKKIGLAYSQNKLAEPLKVLQVRSLKQVLSEIISICRELKIEALVIGLPDGFMAEKIKEFAQKLKKGLNLPLYFQDETLSSCEARKKLILAGKPKRKRKEAEHLFAACLILQTFLDEQEQKLYY